MKQALLLLYQTNVYKRFFMKSCKFETIFYQCARHNMGSTKIRVLVFQLVFFILIVTLYWNGKRAVHFDISRNEKSVQQEEVPFYRIDTTPEKTGKLPFLQNYKNPCWKEASKNGPEVSISVRCLPYFYLAGPPKCATTDLHHRLVMHPLISSTISKELHWISKRRFETGNHGKLSQYLKIFDEVVEKDITRIQEHGYYNSIFGDCSPSTIWCNTKFQQEAIAGNITTPHLTTANAIYSLNPYAKIIIILRDPITRLFSDYLYTCRRPSVQDFHRRVLYTIAFYGNCLASKSLRHCANIQYPMARMHIGLYHLYIEDFMRIFPREQLKILKFEEYTENIAIYVEDVFKFLDVGLPPQETMLQIIKQEKVNTNAKSYQFVGKMLPQTYERLHDFYKPYNTRLVELLGSKFDFNNDHRRRENI